MFAELLGLTKEMSTFQNRAWLLCYPFSPNKKTVKNKFSRFLFDSCRGKNYNSLLETTSIFVK